MSTVQPARAVNHGHFPLTGESNRISKSQITRIVNGSSHQPVFALHPVISGSASKGLKSHSCQLVKSDCKVNSTIRRRLKIPCFLHRPSPASFPPSSSFPIHNRNSRRQTIVCQTADGSSPSEWSLGDQQGPGRGGTGGGVWEIESYEEAQMGSETGIEEDNGALTGSPTRREQYKGSAREVEESDGARRTSRISADAHSTGHEATPGVENGSAARESVSAAAHDSSKVNGGVRASVSSGSEFREQEDSRNAVLPDEKAGFPEAFGDAMRRIPVAVWRAIAVLRTVLPRGSWWDLQQLAGGKAVRGKEANGSSSADNNGKGSGGGDSAGELWDAIRKLWRFCAPNKTMLVLASLCLALAAVSPHPFLITLLPL
ncbi:unnamed protein product [Closterium sp. NIES-54]